MHVGRMDCFWANCGVAYSRIDAVVPFRSLSFEDLVQIAYWDLRGLGLNVSYETVYELTQKYYPVAREYGMRYFLKKIQEDVLSR